MQSRTEKVLTTSWWSNYNFLILFLTIPASNLFWLKPNTTWDSECNRAHRRVSVNIEKVFVSLTWERLNRNSTLGLLLPWPVVKHFWKCGVLSWRARFHFMRAKCQTTILLAHDVYSNSNFSFDKLYSKTFHMKLKHADYVNFLFLRISGYNRCYVNYRFR